MNEFDNERDAIKNSSRLHDQIHYYLEELEGLSEQASPSILTYDRHVLINANSSKINGLINEFEMNPKLLDTSLESYIHLLANLYLAQESLRSVIGGIVYNFGKVRGFKIIVNYFPSELYLINKLIKITKETPDELSVFVGICWLCTLSLLPFSLSSIDKTIPLTIYNIAMKNLLKYSNGSKNQVMSLILLSKLLVRKDCTEFFELFFQGIELSHWIGLDDTHKVGHYLTINKILKLKILLNSEQMTKIYQCITNDILLQSSPSNLNLLFLIKILSKLSINYVQMRDFHMVELIVNILINDILLEITNLDFNLRYSMAKALSKIVASLAEPAVNYKQQLIDFVFSNLDVIDDEISIAKNHTILLTFGYLVLNRAIQGEYVSRLVNVVHKSVFLQIRNQRVDMGSCIRDSSCFIIWSLVKNNNNLNSEQLALIFNDLIKVLTFDKELVLKKCSIAIIQELIGRYGTTTFQDNDFNSEELGQFIVNFLEAINCVKLKARSSNYGVIDLLFDTIDLGFLLPPLLDEICETSGDLGEEAKYLNKLLLQPKNLLVVGTRYTIDLLEISYKLVKGNRWQYLFALPQIPHDELSRKFSSFEFQHDHNLLKGYLLYLVYSNEMNDLHWDNFIKIIKHNDTSFVEEIGQFLKSCDSMPNAKELLIIVRANTVLSRVIFNFNHWTKEQVLVLVSAMKNPAVDIEIRKNLLDNLCENYQRYPVINELYQLFDDYTTTIQGDVGSKLRFSMLELVSKHNLMDEEIRRKLIRLSGELMDKLRYLSFELISRGPISDENSYWRCLFDFYTTITDHEEKEQFWKGCCFTIGSFKGNSKVINQSFLELLRYEPKTEDLVICLDILEQASTSVREQKLKLMMLQMFLKLFQSNFQFHDSLDYNRLFAISYNIYQTGKNATQAITILRILYHISTKKAITVNLKSKIYQIFTRIIDGRFYQKLKINDILLQLLIDKNVDLDRYQQIDWTLLNADDKLYLKNLLLLDLQTNS